MKENLLKAYNDVFDSQGNIKNCGRDKCKKLIVLCKQCADVVYCGNEETGVLDVRGIRIIMKGVCGDAFEFC